MAMIGENYLFNRHDRVGELMYQINRDSITPVQVRAGERLANLATILEMRPYYLKKINAHLKNEQVPYRGGYSINIPTSKVPMFYSKYAQAYQASNATYSRNSYISYR
jgi:hypothetical protein